MTLRRLEEFIGEVSTLATEEFCRVIVGLDDQAIFHDTASWKAYLKVERCEELANILREKIANRESKILSSMIDLLDLWECEGFYKYQIYSQERWVEYWHLKIDAETRLWVARKMLARIRGAL